MGLLSFFRRRSALSALHSPSSTERLKAVNALEALASDQDRLALESVVLDHTFPDVQAAAARALGRIGHPASAAVLKRVLAPGFFPPSRGSGIDVGDQDAFHQRRIRRAAEEALTRLRSP